MLGQTKVWSRNRAVIFLETYNIYLIFKMLSLGLILQHGKGFYDNNNLYECTDIHLRVRNKFCGIYSTVSAKFYAHGLPLTFSLYSDP